MKTTINPDTIVKINENVVTLIQRDICEPDKIHYIYLDKKDIKLLIASVSVIGKTRINDSIMSKVTEKGTASIMQKDQLEGIIDIVILNASEVADMVAAIAA